MAEVRKTQEQLFRHENLPGGTLFLKSPINGAVFGGIPVPPATMSPGGAV